MTSLRTGKRVAFARTEYDVQQRILGILKAFVKWSIRFNDVHIMHLAPNYGIYGILSRSYLTRYSRYYVFETSNR